MAPFHDFAARFPREPKAADIEHLYACMRKAGISINKSRAQYMSQCKAKDLKIVELQTELTSYANDAALDYQEKARLLSILSKYRDVFAAMETAGDELVEGLHEYDHGARPYYGGNPIRRLIHAVRAFAKAWEAAKEMAPQVKQIEAGV